MEERKIHHEGTKDTKKSRVLAALQFEILCFPSCLRAFVVDLLIFERQIESRNL